MDAKSAKQTVDVEPSFGNIKINGSSHLEQDWQQPVEEVKTHKAI
jgi:hypothetical protein